MSMIEIDEETELPRVWGNVLRETRRDGVAPIGIVGLDEETRPGFAIVGNRHAQGATDTSDRPCTIGSA